MSASDPSEEVNAIRVLIDQYDANVVLPAYAHALSHSPEPVDVAGEVDAFLQISGAALAEFHIPVLDSLPVHLETSVRGQLTEQTASNELVRAFVRRNWLATAVIGPYKAVANFEPLQQDRVTAMKQARTNWLTANNLSQYADAVAKLYQTVSDDADVYQRDLAKQIGTPTLGSLSAVFIASLLSQPSP